MISHFSLVFDFLWKLLMVTGLASTFIFTAFLLVQPFLKKISGGFFNRIAQISVLGVLGILLLSAGLLMTLDQELQVRCFGSFIENQKSLSITRLLAFSWIFLSAFFLAWDFLKLRKFHSKIKEQTIENRGETIIVEGGGPFVVGFLRPLIVLPQGLPREGRHFEHVLSHEKTHVRNHDGLWNLAALFVQRICWFHPLSFFFEQGRRLALEMSTDEETIVRGQFNPTEYCQTLLEILHLFGAPQSRWATGATLEFSQMKDRLQNLNPSRARRSSRLKFFILAFLVAGWLIGIKQSFASIQVRPAPQMCYQVQHEKVIESWLNIEPAPNKCE